MLNNLNNPKKRILLRQAQQYFEARNHEYSLRLFSEALSMDPQDMEAKIGVILSDMAQDMPNEAYGFYELYQAMLKSSTRNMKKYIQKNILEGIRTFDQNLEKISMMIYDEKQLLTERISGVLYSDFKEMALESGFRETFQNLIFSSKIIFTKKEDFFDFLELLVENDFVDYCLQYIENMKHNIGLDSRICEILERIYQKEK